MAVMIGFQVYLRGRTFLTTGGVLRAERQSNIAGVSLEHGCTRRSVGILRGRKFKVAGYDVSGS